MAPHYAAFPVVQMSRFLQDPVGNADLTDVVHRCCMFQGVAEAIRLSQRFRDSAREFGYPLDVFAGILVAILARLGQSA